MLVDRSTHTGNSHTVVVRALLLASIFMTLLSSCSGLGGPEYSRPDVVSKQEWSDDPGARISAQDTIQPDWWKGFNDAYLNELVDRAISGNIDIRVLAARSGVAKAAISQAEAGLLPTLSAGLGTDTIKSSGNSARTQYSVASDVIWEADIWGKVRKGVEAQQADYKATEAGWRAGYLVMVSDVATAYFQIRQFDEQIKQQFADIHAQAVRGETEHWRESDDGRLAEIIVLDQFSRNMFRGQESSFAHDAQAIELAKAAVAAGTPGRLDKIRASFVLMPFMHSESNSEHLTAKPLFEQFCEQSTQDFERRHAAIIERFGRYPHRNEILGRESTAEEIEFLTEAGSSF